MDVSLSRVINVTLLSTPQGLANFNVNSLALFTNETPGAGFGADGYKIYTSPDGVATDFGTASETYLQAVAIFSQSPNILTGGGYLVVIPLLTNAAATSGTMLTETPGALAAFTAITSGGFKVSIDGTEEEYLGLDFTADTSLDEIATTINDATSADGAVTTYDPTANGNTGGFLITSATTGATSTISKLSAPTSGTDISGTTLLNGAGNPRIINGQASATSEDLVSAIVRTNAMVYYFGVLSMTDPSVADVLNLASYMQTQDKMFFIGRSSSGEILTIFKLVQEGTLTHTRCLYYTTSAQAARIAVAAYASRLFGVDYSGSNTLSTMNLKTLAGIQPDAGATSDNIDNQATAYGFDIYVSIAGDPCVLSYGANEYADQIYGELWMKLAIQIAGFNYLKTTNTKIPQTEPGMDGLKGAYASVLLQGIRNGFLANGLLWTTPTTFGNPEDLRRNITDTGYYIYSQPIALQDPADRVLRKAPLVQIAAKEAGAIHKSNVIVTVN